MSESGPTLRRRQAKLARSVGESPTQVMLSRQPGSECCVSRRRRRPRSVHSGCVGCLIEPRNGYFARVGGPVVGVVLPPLWRQGHKRATYGQLWPWGKHEMIFLEPELGSSTTNSQGARTMRTLFPRASWIAAARSALAALLVGLTSAAMAQVRSEERRVGKEWRARWSQCQ